MEKQPSKLWKWLWSLGLNFVFAISSLSIGRANASGLLIFAAFVIGIFLYPQLLKRPSARVLGVQWGPARMLTAYHFAFGLLSVLTMNVPCESRDPFKEVMFRPLMTGIREIYYDRFALSVGILVLVYAVWFFVSGFIPVERPSED